MVKKQPKENKIQKVSALICKAVGLAAGVAVVVMSALGVIELKDAVSLVAIGLMCLALASFVDIQGAK